LNDIRQETDEEAEARIRQFRTSKALGQAGELAHYVRGLITAGKVERGETLPEWSAPMKITAADDLDALFAQLVDWVTYWSRQLEFMPSSTAVVAHRNSNGVQGFKAGTTPEGAAMLVRIQTMWLLNRAAQINRHPTAAAYHENITELIWSIRSRYPTAPRPPKPVSSRPCPICSEPAVGAEWFSADLHDVLIRCEHCGHEIEPSRNSVSNWLDADDTMLVRSDLCGVGEHTRCTSFHCACRCHTPTHASPPIPEGLCGINGCVYKAGHELRRSSRAHSWKVGA
jgi:hypothetical protein